MSLKLSCNILYFQVTDIEEEKVQIASERDQLFENVSELVESKMFVEQELDHLQRTVDDLKQKSRPATPIDSKYKALMDGKVNIEVELEKLHKSIETMRSKAATPVSMDWNNEWQQECERLRQENRKMRNNYDKLRDENMEVLIKLKDENVKLNKQLKEESEMLGKKNINDKLEDEHGQLTKENVHLIKENKRLTVEVADIQKQVEQLEKLAVLNYELQAENENMKMEMKEVIEELRTVKAIGAEKDRLVHFNTELQQANNDLKSENRTIMVQLHDIEQNLEAALSMKDDQKERKIVVRENNELKKDMSHLTDMLRRQEIIINDLSGQVDSDSVLRENYKKLLQDSEKMRTNMDNLKVSLKDQMEESMKVSEQNGSESDALELEKQRLQDKNSKLSLDIEQLQAKLTGAIVKPEKAVALAEEPPRSHMAEENKRLRLEVQQLQRSFAKIEIENEKDMCVLRDENYSLHRKIDNVKGRLNTQLSPSFEDCMDMDEILDKLEQERIDKAEATSPKSPTLVFNPTLMRIQADYNKVARENNELKDEMFALRNSLTEIPSVQEKEKLAKIQIQQQQKQIGQLQSKLAVSINLKMLDKNKHK